MAQRLSLLPMGETTGHFIDTLRALVSREFRMRYKGSFFGILYKKRLYFRVSDETLGEYKKRKAKPFEPFEGRKGTSKSYYEVPVEILESPRDLVAWAKKAVKASRERNK